MNGNGLTTPDKIRAAVAWEQIRAGYFEQLGRHLQASAYRDLACSYELRLKQSFGARP